MAADTIDSPALTYPDYNVPVTWGNRDGDINSALLTKIRKDHAEIQRLDAQVNLGGDINFFLRSISGDSLIFIEDNFQEDRDRFVEATKAAYIEWFWRFKTAQSDTAIFDKFIERINQFTPEECVMAALQKEFYGRVEFNFPSIDYDYPVDERHDFSEYQFMLLRRAMPDFLPATGTHDKCVKEYYDNTIPEFQIKPTDPVSAIALTHEVLSRAHRLAQNIGYIMIPAVQHFHVSVVKKDGGSLTEFAGNQLPSPSYHKILSELTNTVDHLLPLLYPTHDSNDFFWDWARETREVNSLLEEQKVRVTLSKDIKLYNATIRALPDRFEFRCAYDNPPHMAFSVALITASILKALKQLEKAGEIASPSGEIQSPGELEGKRVIMTGRNTWNLFNSRSVTSRFITIKAQDKLASLLGDDIAARITEACGMRGVETARLSADRGPQNIP